MRYSNASKIKKKKTRSKVVTFPSTQRITCSECGNNKEFLEVSDGVILTTGPGKILLWRLRRRSHPVS